MKHDGGSTWKTMEAMAREAAVSAARSLPVGVDEGGYDIVRKTVVNCGQKFV